MKKEKYEVPETDIITFATDDVITTSDNETDVDWE